MKRWLPALLIVTAAPPAPAVICKSVDAQGVVSYTDVPVEECSTPVRLPEVTRYRPVPIGAQASTGAAPPAPGDAAAPFTGYTEMRIEQPAASGTVRNAQGKVPVVVRLSPELQPGHRLQLVLDGRALDPVPRLAMTLPGVSRGTHLLTARIVGAGGEVLRSVGPVRFTLHVPVEKKPAAPTSDGPTYAPVPSAAPGTALPDFGAATAPVPTAPPGGILPEYAGNAPTDGTHPAYRPSGEAISQTPGRTNPAFAPATAPVPSTPGRTNPAFVPTR